MRPSGIKPQPGKIADIFIISPVQITELLFHDPNQAPEYGENYGQTPSPGQMEIAESNREMAVRLGWNPCMYDPRLPGLEAGWAIHAEGQLVCAGFIDLHTNSPDANGSVAQNVSQVNGPSFFVFGQQCGDG